MHEVPPLHKAKSEVILHEHACFVKLLEHNVISCIIQKGEDFRNPLSYARYDDTAFYHIPASGGVA